LKEKSSTGGTPLARPRAASDTASAADCHTTGVRRTSVVPEVDGEETVVFVRVVRFTDVTAERVEALVARVEETGPPPGVSISKLQLLFDEAQGTAVVLQYFDNESDMRTGAETFAAMDPADTPGTRASVDAAELKLERTP
jgi:hypothetical protein